MTNKLTEAEFKETFGSGMTNITELEIDDPIDIWKYAHELTQNGELNSYVYERELVEYVYRNNSNTYDQILLPSEKQNVFLVIVIDILKNEIYGHRLLDLNKEFGVK